MQTFSNNHFVKFSGLIFDRYGIFINKTKKDALRSKLDKLMEKNGINSYDEYYNILDKENDKKYLTEFTSYITTNKTDFFREKGHFDFIRENIGAIIDKAVINKSRKEIRVWSAGCSSGQEPYTIAMVLQECTHREVEIKILATDLSAKVLTTAQKGSYPPAIEGEISRYYLNKYFRKVNNEYLISDNIKNLVTFRMFNLMDPFPFRNNFDMIFCRNVMIYFDNQVQQRLIDKFYEVLEQEGLLFIGHSESLINKSHRLKYVQPAIYMK